MRRGSPSQNLQTVTWLIWHIGLKVTGRRPCSSILKSSWCIASAQNYYSKSIHILLLVLKSYEYQWHNATFITLQKRSRNSLLRFCFVLDLWTESKIGRSETPPPTHLYFLHNALHVQIDKTIFEHLRHWLILSHSTLRTPLPLSMVWG